MNQQQFYLYKFDNLEFLEANTKNTQVLEICYLNQPIINSAGSGSYSSSPESNN